MKPLYPIAWLAIAVEIVCLCCAICAEYVRERVMS